MTVRRHVPTSCDALCGSVASYPCTLSRSESSRQTLSIYHQTLSGSEESPYGELELFNDGSESIYTLDFLKSTGLWSPTTELKGIDQVTALMNKNAADPMYRFIHADSSRDPLNCSQEQLSYIFQRYQVMATFLEHVFTFCYRENPHMQAAFGSEDYLHSDHTPSLPPTNPTRSGGELRVQHCFNLVGVEYESGSPGKPDLFKYRQTAAYYSLDLVTGHTTWIVIKADEAVRNSIEHFTESLDESRQPSSSASGFSVSLESHLILLDWVLQNWTPYVNHLQAQHASMSTAVSHTPIVNMTTDPAIQELIKRRSGLTTNGATSGFQRQNSRTHSWLNSIPLSTLSRRESNHPPQKAALPGRKRPDLTKMFNFDELQGLHRKAAKLQNAVSVIDQNKTVLQDMIEHFQFLEKSDIFRQHIDVNLDKLHTFFQKGKRCIRELETQQNRLIALQAELERTISLFNGILQYHDMRIGESYAQLAKASTDKMEQLTLRTKHETVSIHVITILTLFFLPATFVAVRSALSSFLDWFFWVLTESKTFFGSGVIDFEHGPSTSEMGYWVVRWGALKLFGAVCGPLTGIVLSAWAFTYFRSRRRQRLLLTAA